MVITVDNTSNYFTITDRDNDTILCTKEDMIEIMEFLLSHPKNA